MKTPAAIHQNALTDWLARRREADGNDEQNTKGPESTEIVMFHKFDVVSPPLNGASSAKNVTREKAVSKLLPSINPG
jgi:hypothetical protein